MASSDPSTLIESINWYRGAMDVATALVVIGLLGEYRTPLKRLGRSLVSFNWKASRLRFLALIFPIMVVVGVAGELAVNLRVSLIENAWEISQLPRDLSDTQAIAIAEKLVPFKGMHFDLAMHQDLEPMRLLDKVENALILAGWQEAPPPPGIALFERGNRPHVAIRTMAGIWIQYPQRSGESFKLAATTLAEELRATGLTVSLVTITGTDPYDLDKIHVWVGAKP